MEFHCISTAQRTQQTGVRFASRLASICAVAMFFVSTGSAAESGNKVNADPSADQVAEMPKPVPAPPGPADEFNRGVPRGAMEGYLLATRERDYARAANYLDLSRLPRADRDMQGPVLARQLKTVLSRTLWVDLELLSPEVKGYTEDGLPSSRDFVGRIESERGPVDILLQRVPRQDGVYVWQLSSATVAAIPALYAEFGYGPLGEFLPAPFFEFQFLEVELWQWIGLLFLVFMAYVLALLCTCLVTRVLSVLVHKTRTGLDDRVLSLSGGPLRLIIAVLLFSTGRLPLGLSLPVRESLGGIENVLLIVAVTWLILRLVDLIAEVVRETLIRRGQAAAISLVPPGSRTVKTIVASFATIAMLDNLGFNVTALVAGLGVGGIAVALAAQKSIENLFGGIVLYLDQPVSVGDFCRFGDKVGTVEDVGLRSSRVRTLDRTVISVPNGEFANLQLENFAKRDKFWYHPTIGLRYETTPDQIRYVLVEIRRMLYAHPKVDPDPARIRFVGFGAYSLDLDIFAYVKAVDWSEHLEVAEDLNLRIMDIVERAGSGFAFPSQTTYIENGQPLDKEVAHSVEAEVAHWRAGKELYLPKFPPEKVAEISATLDYPPEGSPASYAST